MEVKVEGGGEFGDASYESICQNIYRDIGLQSNIDSVYLYCNAAEHVFIISVKIGRVSNPVTVGDMTLIAGEDILKVTKELYAPRLLALLWDRYGEKVKQLSRLEINIKLEEKEMQELRSHVVYDPRVDLTTRILDGLDRILPEGARVRYSIPSAGRITIIASENPIEEDWKKKANDILRKISKGEA